MIYKRGQQYKLSLLPLSVNTRKRPQVDSSTEKVQCWHVLHKFPIDMFLTRYCNVYVSQYKLKEVYIAWKNVLKSWQGQQIWDVSAVPSVMIFRQDTSTITFLTHVPWPLRTGSPTNTRCFCLLLTTPLHLLQQSSNTILLIFLI